MKKKYLFIVTEIESANGICCLNVMNEIKKEGNEVYCITNYDGEKTYKKNEINFFTVKPRLNYVFNRLSRKIENKFLRRLFLMCITLINKFKLLLSVGTWPLISPLYSYRIYRMAKKIVKEYNIDCIIPVYSQIDTLIAANIIKKNNDNIVYIPYFLDALSGGYGPRMFSDNWVINRGLKWEKKLLSNADIIIMMESVRNYYDKIKDKISYYDKIFFVDLPLLNEVNLKNGKKKDNNIIILYAGSLPSGIRNPEYFINLFSRIKSKNINLYFIGTKDCEIINNAALKDNRIKIIGKIPYDEVSEYEECADILLNIGNTNENMTPSKIFEYMSYKKPIISTCPIENEPCINYLNKYKLTYFVKEYGDVDIDKDAYDLENYILNTYNKRADYKDIVVNFEKNIPNYTSKIIKKITEEKEK